MATAGGDSAGQRLATGPAAHPLSRAGAALSRLPAGDGSAERLAAKPRRPAAARCPAERLAGAGAALSLRSRQRAEPAAGGASEHAIRRAHAGGAQPSGRDRCGAVHHE
ncbi:hypothetical protein AT59_12760 [Aeromonas hydrophila AD9]|nr:hypothetical protein AT59_12760 [Aeromonas hydrophila AD9]